MHWLHGDRNFDLWITYYGERHDHRYRELATFYNTRPGSKFQNLKFAYDTWPERFAAYDAIMVLDDDIVITGDQISRLFEYRDLYDLWLLQPAFNPRGKISWPITKVNWNCELRFTNFVELGCPLFRRDKLDIFMTIYDPVLVGYGIDWWYLHILGAQLEGRVAVVDNVACINPRDRSKGSMREIDKLQSQAQREAIWQEVRQLYSITNMDRELYVYRRVLKPLPARWASVLFHLPTDAIARTRRLVWLAKRQVLRAWANHGATGNIS